MDWQTLFITIARRGLAAAAGALITLGWLQPTMKDAFMQIGLGIATGVGSLALSWWNEKGHAEAAAKLAELQVIVAARRQQTADVTAKMAVK